MFEILILKKFNPYDRYMWLEKKIANVTIVLSTGITLIQYLPV